ncbi:inosine/xanthosine triphosphatase [Candidatus Microgenomates bacterium]|nr:inosine/xanthosine triphosphatase [Candidatus Microgenomates bacterium]
MLIAVGSDNPVKINAVKNVVEKIWPGSQVIPVKVSSGVSDQPIGTEESIKGAINRAQKARIKIDADFGVGLEGAVSEIKPFGFFNIPWCAVVDKKGKTGLGIGGGMEITISIEKEILKGKELGEVMDEKTGIKNSKRKMGAIGILTGGLLTRQKAYEMMLIFALTKFIKPDFYDEV